MLGQALEAVRERRKGRFYKVWEGEKMAKFKPK